MPRIYNTFMVAGLAAALCAAVGCSRGPGLSTVPAAGNVTYKGQPVAGATVTFYSTDKAGKTAGAVTNDQGNFQLKTYVAGTSEANGALAGDYKVSVTKTEVAGSSADAETPMASMDIASGTTPEPKSLIPAKYNNPETSGLTATVKPTGGNNFPLELTD